FTHASGIEASGAFTATVSDGSNPWTGVSISGPDSNGVYTVTATQPPYSEEATKTVTVTISESGEAPASTPVTDSLMVNEPDISGTSATLASVAEGAASATVEVATFTHANGVEDPSHFSATVDWGQGPVAADTVTQDSNGTYHVT